MNINMILKEQRMYFQKGITKNIKYRDQQLYKLKQWIVNNETLILNGLKKDLNKSPFEAYTMEIGLVLAEIEYARKNLKKWTKKKLVKTPISQMPSKSYVYEEPYGVVLIISPWNYPFLLSIGPMIGAISAGNCIILKVSEHSKHTSAVIKQMVHDIYPESYAAVIEGDKEVCRRLLCEKLDYIFFTGGVNAGRSVMRDAANNLTPVTLELGGKSPCIVDRDANIPLTAKRIVWGKYINAGQTCVAPDYLMVHHKVKNDLLFYIDYYIKQLYGQCPCDNPAYPKIINETHFYRLLHLMEDGHIHTGGGYNRLILKIEPTVLDDVTWASEVMQEEIFGPILPVLEFGSLKEAVYRVNRMPKPLALYYFGKNKSRERYVLKHISFGGGCVNDTLVHLSSPNLPFGGVGESGMGAYHGKWGFDTFSHKKSIMKKSSKIDLPFRYPPYRYCLESIKKLI